MSGRNLRKIPPGPSRTVLTLAMVEVAALVLSMTAVALDIAAPTREATPTSSGGTMKERIFGIFPPPDGTAALKVNAKERFESCRGGYADAVSCLVPLLLRKSALGGQRVRLGSSIQIQRHCSLLPSTFPYQACPIDLMPFSNNSYF